MKGKIGIIGASGFIGGVLARQASEAGWTVVGYSRRERDADGPISEWRRWSGSPEVSGLDALVNLAGEAIDQRWTEEKKRLFRESRVGVTQSIVAAIEGSKSRPQVLLNGSAVGIYGDRGDERLTESSSEGSGYLASLCADWEQAAAPVTGLGVRLITYRTGIVLGRGGAAWEKMRKVFSLGAGGNLGSGEQWMPWIHVEDLAGGMLRAIESGLSGPINGTAPEPERNADFTRKLASQLRRPAFMHAPEWALKLALGGFAGALLASQRAVPAALDEAGHSFRFPRLEDALDELID